MSENECEIPAKFGKTWRKPIAQERESRKKAGRGAIERKDAFGEELRKRCWQN